MSLTKYKQKRDFKKTPEPAGRTRRAAKDKSLRFVIQKHDATRLHYDFRLEWDGVLKSWAVPKGPSLDPAEKRLAVEVEDHPLDYGTFEGTIPAGEYGGGPVLLWDQGTWTPLEDATAGLRAGKLKFQVAGEKLQGGYTLVRMPPRKAKEKPQWLLIKERDEHARPHASYDVVERLPKSVVSGRTIQQIARGVAAPARRTKTTAASKTKRAPRRGSTTKKKAAKKSTAKTPGGRPSPLPRKFSLQLATLATAPPSGPEWFYEIKFDGYRLACVIADGKARLLSRNQLDWTNRFPQLVAAVETLPVQSAILDGEAVMQLPDGATSFQALQEALSNGNTSQVVYYAFDLLYLDGDDLRDATLADRKATLKELLNGAPARLQFSDHLSGDGADVLRQCCKLGLEGIIAKRRDGAYLAGRGRDWLKIKCSAADEFVIGGFTEPDGARQGLGSLLLGYYDKQQQFIYAGRVGTGFTETSAVELRRKLDRLQRARPAFLLPPKLPASRGLHWVRPDLVAQVQYSNFTRDGLLRHPSFKGLREDKPAAEVHRDTPIAIASSSAKPTEDDSMPRAKNTAQSNGKSKGKANAEIEIEGVRVTHPDRDLYPEAGVTKRMLAEYYVGVAEWILPHLTDRPLSLLRCPGGQGEECFFQKHMGKTLPEWIRRVAIKESAGVGEYVMVDDARGLVALAQMSVLEIHPWGSRADNVDKPDRLIFDLDPGPGLEWNDVTRAAREVRETLSELGLVSFLKTTGGKGLHVVAPIARKFTWDDVKPFCRGVAERLVAQSPQSYIATMSKAARAGKIFIDYLRNDRGATAVAPYSSRARAGASVSTPLDWSELPKLRAADQFTVLTLPRRLARGKDPWADFFQTKQSLTKAMLDEVRK